MGTWVQLFDEIIVSTVSLPQTSAALLYDAVHMFARSLHMLNQTTPPVFEQPLTCDAANTWEHGERIVSYMKAVGIVRR